MTILKSAVCAAVMFLVCAGASGGGEAHAAYYKYTDGSGAVCITNDLEAVPKKYRATMKVISEESLARKDKGARRGPSGGLPAAPEAAPQPAERNSALPEEPPAGFGGLAARFPWVKPLAFACAALVAFLLLRKLSSVIPSALLAKVIYLAFFLGVFVFAYKSYAEHLTESYFSIKKKVLVMFENSSRREMPDPGETAPAPSAAPRTSP